MDLEVISRFENKINNKHFLDLVFTKKELDYCLKKKVPNQHLAVRFAGKEAVIKACSHTKNKLPLNSIEILTGPNGAPFVTIHKENFSDYKFEISLSHSQDLAIGFVIARKI
ncbi:MAG: holo-ACP synthase [Nanoarchaeota archaeon]|nr:holo-ACP synthase [Nanoarchaeota archaeon]